MVISPLLCSNGMRFPHRQHGGCSSRRQLPIRRALATSPLVTRGDLLCFESGFSIAQGVPGRKGIGKLNPREN